MLMNLSGLAAAVHGGRGSCSLYSILHAVCRVRRRCATDRPRRMRPGKFSNVALARVTRITAFSRRLAEYEVVIREDAMPPLPTRAIAVLFMIAFSVVMVAFCFSTLRVDHHRLTTPCGLAQTTQVDSSGVKLI